MRRSLISCGAIPKPAAKTSAAVKTSAITPEDDMQDEAAVADAMLWLTNNKNPWSTVLDPWKLTSKARMRKLTNGNLEVHEYMNTYPPLKDKSGYQLFEVDMEALYPESSMKLYIEWPMLAALLMNKIPVHSEEEITDSLTADGKKARILISLNKLFPVVSMAKKGRNQWRPSRQESKEGLLLLVKTNGDIQTTLEARRGKIEKYGLKLGPQAVMVGSDEDTVTQSHLVINQCMFETETLMKAVDTVFKAKHALDTPYHTECQREWLFLQLAVHGFSTPHDKTLLDGKTLSLIEEYKAFKESNF